MKRLAVLLSAVAALALAAYAGAGVLETYKVSATLKAGNETPKPVGTKAGATGAFSGSDANPFASTTRSGCTICKCPS